MQSLRYKVGASYFILVLIGLGTSILAVFNFTRLRSTVESLLQGTIERNVTAEHLVRSMDRQELAQTAALVDYSEWELNEAYFNDARDDFLRWYESARSPLSMEQAQLLDSMLLSYRNYLRLSDSLFTLMGDESTFNVAKRFQRFVVRPVGEQLKNQCFRYLETNQAAMLRAEATLRETTLNATLMVVAASVVSILLSFIASVWFTRAYIRPAERLTDSVRRISRGSLNQKIDIVGDDEIGVLSSEFNKMTERLRTFEQMDIQQIIAEKKKSETIVASIADPIIVTDEHDHALLMNQAAERLLDIGKGKWVGKPIGQLVRDERWADILQTRTPDRGTGEKESLLSVVRNGATMYFRPRQARIVDEQGNILSHVTLLQDVTRFKDIDRMKSEFIATVSHELRTPLTSLSMGVDILSKEVIGPLTQRQHEILDGAKDDCERLRKLVKDLLDLSKLESGSYERKREPVDLAQVIADSARPLSLPFEEKKIEFILDIAPDLPRIIGDAQQLSWVVANLLTNALRHTDAGGSVRLSAVRDDAGARVSVRDTGSGISPEDRERVFEKFVQVRTDAASTPGSVGLGLSIAREVVEAHGGRIWVESTPGVGSTFIFTLPERNDRT